MGPGCRIRDNRNGRLSGKYSKLSHFSLQVVFVVKSFEPLVAAWCWQYYIRLVTQFVLS